MARSLDAITVRDVHETLPAASLLAVGLTRDHPQCPVERAVEAGRSPLIEELEERTLGQIGTLTLESFAAAARENETSRSRAIPR